MDVLEQFLNMAMVVFSLVIWVLVFAQRKLVEYALSKLGKSIKEAKLWRELLLPLGPMGTGAIVAFFATSYPYPEMFAGSDSGRVFFGIVCGLMSGFIYRLYKQFFGAKLKGALGAAAPTETSSEKPEEDVAASE